MPASPARQVPQEQQDASGSRFGMRGNGAAGGATCIPSCDDGAEIVIDHLAPVSDAIQISIAKEWQREMDLANFLRRPCAACSGLGSVSELARVDASSVDFTLLRNDDLPTTLLPSTYNLAAYDYAILEPKGLVLTEMKGPILLCKTCNNDLAQGQMPRLALCNWLYYAREHIPPLIQQDLREMSVFEKALICRVRTNSLLCRFSLLRERTDDVDGFSTRKRHLKGNIISTLLDIPRLNSVLPPSPSDIADTICALIVSHTPPTRETIDCLHPILVRKSRIKRLIQFLIANNPHYRRSQSFRGFSSEYLDSLFEGPSDAGVPQSVRIGHLPVNEAIESVMSDYTGKLDGVDGLYMENVAYTLGDRSARSYREMTLLAVQQCKEGKPFLHSSSGSSLIPDIDNPNWLSWAQPNADPFGLGGFNDPQRKRQISMEAQIRHLLNVQDAYFENDPVLTFDIYHIIRKGSVNTSLRFCVPLTTYGRVVEDLTRIDKGILAGLRKAFRADPNYRPTNPDEIRILQTLASVSPVAKKIPGSVAQRISMRNEIRAVIGQRGLPTLFVTLNPSDFHNPIVTVLASRPSVESALQRVYDLSAEERSQLALKHPVACAQFFDAMISAFVKIVLCHSRSGRRGVGIFGRCDAYYGTVEAQGRGSLHCHMLIWLRGHLPPERLASVLRESPEYGERLKRWVDSVMDSGFLGTRRTVNMDTPEELRTSEGHPAMQIGPNTSELEPKEFLREAREHVDKLLLRFNWHVHTGTCWKYLSRRDSRTGDNCCFGMDGSVRPETVVNQEDGTISIRRRHPRMTSFNPIVTLLLKCNTDIKLVGSGEDAKAFMYYVTDYITKAPLSMHAGLTALSYAIQQAEAHGLINDRPLDDTDTRKAMTIAVNSMLGHQELSHPQVMSFILGGGERYTSELFQPFNWAEVLRYVIRIQSKPADQSQEALGDISMSVSREGGEICASNQLLDYIFRPTGEPFESMNLYTHISRTCKQPGTPPVNGTRGFSQAFSSLLHPQALSHHLRMRKIPVTPVLLGPPIARRRGTEVERERWSMDMCILFRPWRVACDLKLEGQTWTEAFHSTLPLLSRGDLSLVENMSLLSEAKQARDERPRQHHNTTRCETDRMIGIDSILDHASGSLAVDDDVFRTLECDDARQQSQLEHPALQQLEALIGRESKTAFVACMNGSSDLGAGAIGGTPEHPYSDTEGQMNTRDVADLIWKQTSYMMTCKPRSMPLSTDMDSGSALADDIACDVCSDPQSGWKRDHQPLAELATLGNSGEYHQLSIHRKREIMVELAESRGLHTNPEQLRVFDIVGQHIIHGGPQMLLYVGGKGGTGKSYLIQAIVDLLAAFGRAAEIRLAAPTGIAASLIGGSTIHSLLQMSPNTKQTSSKNLSGEWRGVCYLVIDEVSMVGAQLLATISQSLKLAKADAKGDSLKLFGGVNVIFLGDFYQLSPPKQASLFSYKLVRDPSFMQTRNNDSLDAIAGAYIWRQVEDAVILRKSKRHSSDPILGELLERIRINACRDQSGALVKVQGMTVIEHLRRREMAYVASHDPAQLALFKDAPVIVGSKKLCDTLNVCLLNAHAERLGQTVEVLYSTDLVHRKAVDRSTANYLWSLPTRTTNDALGRLPIFRGMRVIITENISMPYKIVNGSEGVVVDYHSTTDELGVSHAGVVYVDVANCEIEAPGLKKGVVPLFPTSVSIKHTVAVGGSLCKSFRRRQIPVIPLYSYTDYKSQGRTLERAVVDITSSQGQGIYVMLSRTRTLDGMLVLRWFPNSQILKRTSGELRQEIERLDALDRATATLYGKGVLAPDRALRELAADPDNVMMCSEAISRSGI